MYEIHEDRLVTSNGRVPGDDSGRQHYARIESDGGTLRVELAGYDPEIGFVLAENTMSDGRVGLQLRDLRDSLDDLSRLAGADVARPEVEERNERVAQVVERVCRELESDDDPVRTTLASDLRATVLGLLTS